MKVIGKPRRRVDGRAKVTGQTRFADDIVLPRMLHMKLLRSPHAHAMIESIDFSKAVSLSGVHLVLTGKDFPVTFGILPVTQDEYPLAPEHVRYVGDPIAAVVAKDEQTATQALDLIEVKYHQLKTISDPQEALENPEPRIHAYSERGNIHRLQAFEFGNVDEAFARSDHVFEDLFFYEGNTHLPIEQHASLAALDGEGKLTLWSSTQVPHYVHRALARVLEMPAAHIRVIACPNGGGFGGKSDPFSHEIVAAKLSMKTGRPVKITLSREEVFYCHRGRHPVSMWIKTGLKRDGTITAMHFRSALDGGAYGSYGVASLYYTGALQTVTYRIPRYKLECHIDKFCHDLGLDPAEWRLRNTLSPGAITANQMKVRTIGLRECLERALESSGFAAKRGRLGPGRGVGLAASAYISGAGLPIYWNAMPHSGVQIKVDRSGGVAVFCGSTDIGQGSDSVLAYVV